MREIDPNILKDLKLGAILSGRLSETHVKTLQAAPFIFFDNLAEVSISYNLVTNSEASVPGLGSVVKFTMLFQETYKPDAYHDKRVEALVGTVKTLLWPDIDIVIVDSDGKNLKNVKHS